MSNGKIPVYIVQMNHFDPIWRRCWDRPFEYGGQVYASYADVEQAVIDDWLKIAENTEATFVLEQTVSLRKYLERQPEKRDILRKLARDGRFELLAGGEVIPDANMPIGESLVRNMLYGILCYHRMSNRRLRLVGTNTADLPAVRSQLAAVSELQNAGQ